MEVSTKNALSHGILLITLMILLNTCQSGATSSSVLKDLHGLNATTIADNMELEFLMDSEISRKLASGFSDVTEAALIASQAVVKCGSGQSYGSCLPRPNPPPTRDHCGQYGRDCRSRPSK